MSKQDEGEAKGQTDKKRGRLLTVWLILLLVLNSLVGLFAFANLVFSAMGYSLNGEPDWQMLIGAVFTILLIIFVVAIWKWKIWGVYGFGAVSIGCFIIYLAIGTPIYSAVWSLVGMVILLLLVRPVWKYFERR